MSVARGPDRRRSSIARDRAKSSRAPNRFGGGIAVPSRTTRIEYIRQQIVAGVYDTEVRLDAALDRLSLHLVSDRRSLAIGSCVRPEQIQEVA